MKFFKDLAESGAKGAIMVIAGGVLLGTAAAKLSETFTIGILDPVIGNMFGVGNLARQTTTLGEGLEAAVVSWGAVVVVAINFVLVVLLLKLAMSMLARKKTAKKK